MKNTLRYLVRVMTLVMFIVCLVILMGNIRTRRLIEGFSRPSILEKDSYRDEKVFNILLLGLDRRSPEESSRSDAIMVITIDREKRKIKVSSIMRDSYVPIPGYRSNKINAAYTYGGPKLAIETINNNFDLKIRDFVSADFEGFEKLIDSLGGVEIDVKAKEVPYCKTETEGLQTLNGSQALAYSRLRKVGNADFERTERQRRVLQQIYEKLKSLNPEELSSKIRELSGYVETSLNFKEMISIATDALSFDIGAMEEFRVPVSGYFSNETIDGASSLVLDMEENVKRLREFIFEAE